MSLSAEEEAVLLRLRDDFPFYSANALRVVFNQALVPFNLRPAQERLWAALEEQKAKGQPGRQLILKARKHGFSTQGQGIGFQRTTQRPNHTALTVAHDSKTAQELVRISELMYDNVPPELREWLAPEITSRRKSKEMHFGGLNSKMLVDTAREFQAGRGFTYHFVHLSEVAFWPDVRKKMTSILNAVPHDDPDTIVLIESTANGYNYFRELWVAALEGRNDYNAFFVPWHEEARYQRKFLSEEQEESFRATVGTGPWGEDEPHLIEHEGLSLEQLHWRRWAIENLAGADLQEFQQEYPATWEEAFATTGKHVFTPLLVKEVRKRAETTDPEAEKLVLKTVKTTPKRGRFVQIDVPSKWVEQAVPENTKSDLYWRIWDRPREKGQYVVVVDPASEDEATDGVPDWTAIQVLDHKLRVQVAQMRTRAEKDLVAEQAFLICQMYSVRPNRPLFVVEMQGGYGDFIVNRVVKEYGYKRAYRRKPIDPRRREADSELLGFSTNRNTKPRLVDGMKELLRERSHGIRSLDLAGELVTYERRKGGRTEASTGAHDDLLMAYMIAHFLAQEVPVRPDRSPGSVVNIATKALVNPKLGY